ncbi:M24 family metallopeptidase [Mangrovibrevibacter kandeliae]|uniref:M24 family metallopeptidase n=1 Tax=Mangrovibrevibacter kandeliae TaxID=2968473 RepID=UPI002118A399|nr:Xaa-Pro peptidase family protein [Aurantimonas sp. CSK15Z-1]MCQ8783485.1 Xaa-Pro peptidase family protein [Aurantimonas sp. CSK15Z-1]
MTDRPRALPVRAGIPPFDAPRLDALMEAAGLDVLLATSKHNVQYLLGGYRFFMFDYMDATGLSRYLPMVVYRQGAAEATAYVGNSNERFEAELGAFWLSDLHLDTRGTLDATACGIDCVRALAGDTARIGIEVGFLPTDAYLALREALPDAPIADATVVLERLRAIKRPDELAALAYASDMVIEAMGATFAAMRPGDTKHDLVTRLRREQVARDLTFEFCLVTAGRSHNRAPSRQPIEVGDVVSLDSGGNFRGYLGDLCRMGIVGAPDAELVDALAAIEAIQMAARNAIRPGAPGGDVEAAARHACGPMDGAGLEFVVHGMGLVTHEAPRLMDKAPVPYPAADREHPLEPGMVVSIETTWKHRRGFIKLEDTLAVTASGFEAYGDGGRGWNMPSGT